MTRGLDPGWIRERARSLGPWFHNLHLKGVATARIIFSATTRWSNGGGSPHAIPADLSGRSVLDIGCNAGFYSMEMKRRGAVRVLGIDFDEDYLRQARFAAEVEGLDIEFRKLSVYDVGALGESFDLVLFIGVLYHLRHPLLALDLSSRTCDARPSRVPIDAARQRGGAAGRAGLRVLGHRRLR